MKPRAWGADCILIIMAGVDDGDGASDRRCFGDLGMDVLLEVHNEAEMERALAMLVGRLIGINNRDLHSFEVDLAVIGAARAAGCRATGCMVGESGIFVA